MITLVRTLSLFAAHHQSLFFRNEEKLVALLVYSLFIRVATKDFRKNPYLLVMVVLCAQVRSESGITPYRHTTAALHS